MTAKLEGRAVAFLLTDGYEDSELTSPWDAITGEGASATLVAPRNGTVKGKKGHTQRVDALAKDTDSRAFDGLVLPGGVVNADHLRMDADAVALVRGFVEEGKPIGVICHGGWILIEAGGVKGKRMTSYASLRTDLINAGADWVDEEVVIDGALVSSRKPGDLPAFDAAVIERIAAS